MSELRAYPRYSPRGLADYYLKSEADKVITKKDAEIAELKKKLMPCLNGDCILTCEVVEKYGKENAELKAKLEDAKASHYAEMDQYIAAKDAEIQRLKHAISNGDGRE